MANKSNSQKKNNNNSSSKSQDTKQVASKVKEELEKKGIAPDDIKKAAAAAKKEVSKKNDSGKGSKKGNQNKGSRQETNATKTNDIAFWNYNPDLVADAGKIPFYNALGRPITGATIVDDINPAGVTNYLDFSQKIPGGMAIYVGSTVGYSADNLAPVNVAARNVYSFIRHANSGSANYDYPDLMLYLLAAGELIAARGFLGRLYGLAKNYDPQNTYYPDAYIEAMGIQPASIRNNMAQLKYYIDLFSKKISSLYYPKDLQLYARKFDYFSSLYKDEDIEKAQVYFFTPAYFLKYEPKTSDKGGELVPSWFGLSGPLSFDYANNGAGLTFSQMTTFFDDLIDTMLEDEDIGIISGDIRKAYQDRGGLWYTEGVSEDHFVEAGYDKVVLDQVHNLRFAGLPISDSVLKITQDPDTNAILCSPTTWVPMLGDFDHAFLSLDEESTPERLIESTVYTITAKDAHVDLDTTRTIKYTELGSFGPYFEASDITVDWDGFTDFIPLVGQIIGPRPLGRVNNIDMNGWVFSDYANVAIGGADVQYMFRGNPDITAFNFYPRTTQWGYINFDDSDTPIAADVETTWEIDSYAYVSRDVVNRMHEVRMLSLFGVPANSGK